MSSNPPSKIFLGQKKIILPESVIKGLKKNRITEKFYISDLGFYPIAKDHWEIEKKGANHYTFIYCTKGQGSVLLGSKETQIEPNQFFILPKNKKYEFKSHETNPWTIYWFNFNGSIALELFIRYELKKNLNIPFSVDRILLFEKVFNLFNKNSKEELLEYATLLSLNFISSFIYNDFDEQVKIEKEETLIDSIKHFLLNNLDKNFSLDDMATKYNLSKSHLQARFKLETGYPLMGYFNFKKIQQASQYLNCTDLSIKEISFKVGFQDPLYFSRIFKNYSGKSPSLYRNDGRK
jgi:AraC family transcriptional regulator of arabinose operon